MFLIEYSNTGYVLLSFIAEKVDEKSFSQILMNRIAEPLKLKDTYLGGKIGTRENEAQSYYPDDGWLPATETNMSIPMGAGAIVSTPSDINKFYHALFSMKITKPSSVDLMTTLEDNYGFGIAKFLFGSTNMFGHDGGIDGFSPVAGHIVADDLTVCLLSNGSGGELDSVMNGALRIFHEEDYEIPDFKLMVLPLLLTTFSGNPQVINRVKQALDQGANIDAKNTEGDTAIILAGWLTSNLGLIRCLVEQPAVLITSGRRLNCPTLPLNSVVIDSIMVIGVCA